MNVNQLLEANNGVVPFEIMKQHSGLGIAFADGALKRRAHALYLPGATNRADLAAVAHRGVITCVTALEHYGIHPLTRDKRPHIAIPANNHRKYLDKIVLHREPSYKYDPTKGRYADLLSASLRALQCQDFVGAVVIVDQLLNQCHFTKAQLIQACQSWRKPLMIKAIEAGNERARSPLETVARLQLIGQGLEVEVGVVIPEVGEVDIVIGHTIFEFDGWEWHKEKTSFEADRLREQMAAALGYRTVRFTWEQVMAGALRNARKYLQPGFRTTV